MNRVAALYETTLQLDQLVKQEITANNRSETVDQLTKLLTLRGQQIEALQPPFSQEEEVLGKELLPINQRIKEKIEMIFQQLKQDMKTVKKQKQSNIRYVNPYQSMHTFDGRFMDKKK